MLRFVLASGSLKKLEREYGVSYPTIRHRLNILIQKLKVLSSEAETDPFIQQLATWIAEGSITAEMAHRMKEVRHMTEGE